MTKTLRPFGGIEDVLRYEPCTGKLFWTVRYCTRVRAGEAAGHQTKRGYIKIGYKAKVYPAHRLAWYLYTGQEPPSNLDIDHIDRNPLNNKIENLRLVTRAQNRCNSGARINASSKFKGIYWQTDRKAWRAQITKNGKVTNLGSFKDPYDAHLAYCAAAARLHGEFANFG
jgi:hypothetical protein